MPGANQYKAKQFIDAIPKSAGIISTIARRVGCDWHTAKKYIELYPTVKRALLDERERVLDAAESAVIQAITPAPDKEPDLPTAKWYLMVQGADRGYAPKQQVEHTGTVQLVGIDPDSNDGEHNASE